MDITKAQFWNTPNVAGRESFSYAQLLAQLTIDLPTGLSPNVGLAAVSRGSTQSINNLLDTPIVWDTIEYDDLGFLDIGSGSPRDERFIVPDVTPAIERVIFGGAFFWVTNLSGDIRQINMRHNFSEHGSFFPEGSMQMVQNPSDAAFSARNSVNSGPVRVSVGDIFTLSAFHDSGAGLNVSTPTAWIWVIR